MDKSHFLVHVNSIGEIIMSITIVSFDINSGDFISKISEYIEPTEQQRKLGYIFNWDDLLNLYDEKIIYDKFDKWKNIKFNSLDDVLDKISTYIKFNSKEKQICVWGYIPSLNQTKIIDIYNKSDRQKPWEQSDESCTKTLEMITDNKEIDKLKKSVNFNTEDDISKILYQIKLVNKHLIK